MHILEKIVKAKRKELDLKKQLIPIPDLERHTLFDRPVNSMKKQVD